MKETWRWFGPEDPVSLTQVRQSGAAGVVSALHHLYDGREWTPDDIGKRNKQITDAGLIWDVCESIPMSKSIKTRSGDYKQYIANYQNTIRNLAAAGVATICYNFMPVVDWTRTNLIHQLPDKSQVLRFDNVEYIAADVFLLRRPNAADDYTASDLKTAESRFQSMTDKEKDTLEYNILGNLPAREATYTRRSFLDALKEYQDLGDAGLRQNLYDFLGDVVPVAEECNVRLAIHPDDPPFPLFGLPRIVSTAEDIQQLFSKVDSNANGLTFCTGSFGARGDNDLVSMVETLAHRIHFVHLRNVKREVNGSFHEVEHLNGDNDMLAIIKALLVEEKRRESEGRNDHEIPMRPDHGQLMESEKDTGANPGYSYLGRLRGLAELRGVLYALR